MDSSKSINLHRVLPVLVIVLTCGALGVFTLSSRLPAQVTILKETDGQPIGLAQSDAAPAPYTATKICNLQDQEIDESSGIGASRRYPGLFWTHNDSGDSARLFLINKEGKTLTVVHLKNAGALDWEDMAVAGDKEKSWVYAGDIGDNAEVRPNIVVYRFKEPEIDLKNPPKELTLECEKMALIYPDKPHNAETLMADLDEQLLIVTKAAGQAFVYEAAEPFKAGGTQELKKLGELTMPEGFRSSMTTGGDISPDGKHLVVMTYTQMHEWALPGWFKNGAAQWSLIANNKPRIWELPKAKQMEAVCYGLDNKLFSTSEQLPTPFYEYKPTTSLKLN
jgi:hypothetical protein